MAARRRSECTLSLSLSLSFFNFGPSGSLSHFLHIFILKPLQRGVSGGEKRRASIAAELLNDADIIFLDEPTSGLDAYTAARTIKTLKQFCLISNKMVIATIHQPSVEVFYLFDQLILLGAGRPCFAAPINAVDEYFADKIGPTQNPADVIIYEAQRDPIGYAQKWVMAKHDPSLAVPTYVISKIDERTTENLYISDHDSASWCIQFYELIKREVMALYRDFRNLFVFPIVIIACLALLLGGMFRNLENKPTVPYIEPRINFLSLSAMALMIFGVTSTVTVFPSKKLLFQHENRSGNYGVSSWALSYQIVAIPREIVLSIIFAAISWTLAKPQGEFWYFVCVYQMTLFTGASLGMLCGSLAPTPILAALSMTGTMMIML